MTVLLLAVLGLFVGPTEANWWSWTKQAMTHLAVEAAGFDASDTCGWTRDDALHCIASYVDTNHDTEISASEFENAKRRYLPTQARWAAALARKLGWDVTLKDVMWGCDVNKDGRLTLWDWEHGAKSCLPGKADLCKLKTVCDIAERQFHSARYRN